MNHLIHRRTLLKSLAVGSPAVMCCGWADETAADRKRIYIAADDHTDYMWTTDEATYRKAFVRTLDHYLDLADQTIDRPADFQSRWNCDGLFWFREYERVKDQGQVDRLVRRIKSGHISVPMTMLVSCYGGAPTEGVIRGLYYGGHLERRYDLRLRIAVAMENQTLPYGLGMLWAGSGVRYSWKGICGCATKLKSAGRRQHDVYWWVGPDGSRVLMKWYSLAPKLREGLHANEGPGGYAEARDPAAAVEYVCSDAEFQRRNPHSVIGLFGQGWDDLETIVPLADPQRSFPEVAKRLTRADRRIVVSNEQDYFEDMEATHGDGLPEVKQAFGNEWELYNASLAEVSARVKRATEKLRAAEAMAASVAPHRPKFANELNEMRDQAWVAFGLYWEHDWTADGPISRDRRAAWQRKICKQITDYVDGLHDLAVTTLGELIGWSDQHKPTADYRIFVFNPLSWKRTDYVDMPVFAPGDLIERASNDISILDDESRPVPSQYIKRDDRVYLRFLASNVPACGYRVYEINDVDTFPNRFSQSIKVTQNELTEIASPSQRISIADNGVITSWHWNAADQWLIADHQRGNDLNSSSGSVMVESSGLVSTTVRIETSQPLARTTRITMFESIDRIEIDNAVKDNFSDTKTWTYQFNLDAPQTYHEEVGAILRAATTDDGGDYASQNARTDWLTMNHFAAMHDDEVAVTVSNRDCLFFHLGEETDSPMDSQSNVLHVLAGGQVDGPKLGIPSQGGDHHFIQRFALRGHRHDVDEDRNESMRFALEHQNPFVLGPVTDDAGPLPAKSDSLVQIDRGNVVLWAVKPSEEGIENGLIVRLWNLADQPSEYQLTANFPIKRCVRTSHVETDEEPIPVEKNRVSEKLKSGEMRTLRLLRSTN